MIRTKMNVLSVKNKDMSNSVEVIKPNSASLTVANAITVFTRVVTESNFILLLPRKTLRNVKMYLLNINIWNYKRFSFQYTEVDLNY